MRRMKYFQSFFTMEYKHFWGYIWNFCTFLQGRRNRRATPNPLSPYILPDPLTLFQKGWGDRLCPPGFSDIPRALLWGLHLLKDLEKKKGKKCLAPFFSSSLFKRNHFLWNAFTNGGFFKCVHHFEWTQMTLYFLPQMATICLNALGCETTTVVAMGA